MKPPLVWFAVSDKVVLIDGKGMDPGNWDKLPVEGQVYCVRELKFFPEDEQFGVKLVGIHSAKPTPEMRRLGQTYSCWFDAGRFRLASGHQAKIAHGRAHRSRKERK